MKTKQIIHQSIKFKTHIIAVSLLSVAVNGLNAWSDWHFTPGETPGFHDRVGPSPNDVTMRTLEFRAVESGSQMDVFQAIQDFHATRLEWTYIDFDQRNRDAIARVKKMDILFGGAGSASMHGSIKAFPAQPRDIHMVDLDGNPIVQPHMRHWSELRGIGDPSNPAYYEHHLAYYRRIIDFGADALHRDEPESPVFSAERYGGGFSKTGVAGFRDWLMENQSPEALEKIGIKDVSDFNYADHLRSIGAPVGDAFSRFDCPIKPLWIAYWDEITTKFWQRFIAEIKDYGGPSLTFSANNSSLQMWESYHREFDFAISELLLETANPVHIWQRSQAAKSAGKVQVFGPPKTRSQPVPDSVKTRLLRRVIATAYACGMVGKVPWDVFDQSPDGKSRYFAKPSDVADLYAFVRGQDWTNYEEVTALGEGLNQTKEFNGQLVIENGSGGVYAFVRSPVDTTANDLQIHLVDWGIPLDPPSQRGTFRSPTGESFIMYSPAENINRSEPEVFDLYIKMEIFDNPADLIFELRTPKEFDAKKHANAFRTGDYGEMINRTRLQPMLVDGMFHLKVPALNPWGIIHLINE